MTDQESYKLANTATKENILHLVQDYIENNLEKEPIMDTVRFFYFLARTDAFKNTHQEVMATPSWKRFGVIAHSSIFTMFEGIRPEFCEAKERWHKQDEA